MNERIGEMGPRVGRYITHMKRMRTLEICTRRQLRHSFQKQSKPIYDGEVIKLHMVLPSGWCESRSREDEERAHRNVAHVNQLIAQEEKTRMGM